MAASVLVIKKTPIHAFVKVWGIGAATIGLATDIKLANETATSPIVDIRGMWFSFLTSTGNTIVRNGATLWTFNARSDQFQFDDWADTQEHASDIVVNIGASGGSIILELTKKAGYGDSQYNPAI